MRAEQNPARAHRVWGALRLCLHWVALPLAWLLIGLVRGYQVFISPLLPATCRFQPSCSQYMIEAVQKKGPLLGLLKGLWRLARCNPFFRGGYEPVEKQGEPGETESAGPQPSGRDSFSPRRT